MNRTKALLAIAVLGSSLAMSGCEEKIPPEAKAALLEAGDFTYYSIDPNRYDSIPPDAESLHGWKVLAKAPVEGADTRKKLTGALRRGIEENDGKVASCFNPRHAIRVTHEGRVHDFVICFECFSISRYIDGERQKGILVTDSPRDVFNEVLEELGLPLAGKAVRD